MVRRRHARKAPVGTIVIGGCQEYKNEEENAWCKWVKQNALNEKFHEMSLRFWVKQSQK